MNWIKLPFQTPLTLGLAFLLAACGSSAPSPKSQSSASSAVSEDDAEFVQVDDPDGVPSKCVVRKGACMPPIKWAERLCQSGVYEDLALYMFQSGTPWTRFYMRTGLNAVNGWGPTVAEDLVSREEVIPINYRRQSEAFMVEGSLGTFDVIRWNGSCVTLDVGEVTEKTPPTPRNSRVEWKELSGEMQDALLEDPEVERTYQARRKACKGASIGQVTAACESLDKKLPDIIARYVRRTNDLPEPTKHP